MTDPSSDAGQAKTRVRSGTAAPASARASSAPASASAANAKATTERRTPTRAMTPTAALTRHVEWLEFALAAARSEETWRAARLDKATNKNRAKRQARITEVRDEIAELTALLEAIKGLQARAARRTTPTVTRKRATSTPAAKPTRRRRTTAPTGPA